MHTFIRIADKISANRAQNKQARLVFAEVPPNFANSPQN
jgi:hypothetical protein